VNPKPARDRNARLISFIMIPTFKYCLDLSKFDQTTLLSLDLSRVSILNLELLKIHVIPRLVSEVAAMTSKAEAFPKASPAALPPGGCPHGIGDVHCLETWCGGGAEED
jgi:hypothetical protein